MVRSHSQAPDPALVLQNFPRQRTSEGVDGPANDSPITLGKAATKTVLDYEFAEAPIDDYPLFDPAFEAEFRGLDAHVIDPDVELTVITDDIAEVMDRLDPHGEYDPQHELLAGCAAYATEMREAYNGLKNFPESFLRDVYERELQYLIFRDRKVNEHIAFARANKIQVTELHLLEDLDQSQVAVVDPMRKPRDPDGEITVKDRKYAGIYHRARPAWGYFVRYEAEKLYKEGVIVRVGVLSDRPQEFDSTQKTDKSGKGLKEIAYEQFEAAGISKYVDPKLVISSTDSELAKSLPEILQTQMRIAHKTKYDKIFRPSQEIVERKDARQKKFIAAISSEERLIDKRLHYHSKVGVVWAHVLRSARGVLTQWTDDLSSTRLVYSAQAMGTHISDELKPLLPGEDLLLYKPDEE